MPRVEVQYTITSRVELRIVRLQYFPEAGPRGLATFIIREKHKCLAKSRARHVALDALKHIL